MKEFGRAFRYVEIDKAKILARGESVSPFDRGSVSTSEPTFLAQRETRTIFIFNVSTFPPTATPRICAYSLDRHDYRD